MTDPYKMRREQESSGGNVIFASIPKQSAHVYSNSTEVPMSEDVDMVNLGNQIIPSLLFFIPYRIQREITSSQGFATSSAVFFFSSAFSESSPAFRARSFLSFSTHSGAS